MADHLALIGFWLAGQKSKDDDAPRPFEESGSRQVYVLRSRFHAWRVRQGSSVREREPGEACSGCVKLPAKFGVVVLCVEELHLETAQRGD